jgi:hypothetical protein
VDNRAVRKANRAGLIDLAEHRLLNCPIHHKCLKHPPY